MHKLVLILLFLSSSWAQENPNPLRFVNNVIIGDQVSIDLFRQWDKKNSRVVDPVVFVGSSSIRKWFTAEYFPAIPIINRGFGGSHISDVNYFINETVLKHKPKIIVFYAGDNDIYFGKTSQTVLEDYMEFVNQVHSQLPNTRIIFIPIKPSIKRWSLWNEMKKANQAINDYIQKNSLLYYVDTASPMLNERGIPKSSLFDSDNLHLSDEGYDLWSKILKPVLYNVYSIE